MSYMKHPYTPPAPNTLFPDRCTHCGVNERFHGITAEERLEEIKKEANAVRSVPYDMSYFVGNVAVTDPDDDAWGETTHTYTDKDGDVWVLRIAGNKQPVPTEVINFILNLLQLTCAPGEWEYDDLLFETILDMVRA